MNDVSAVNQDQVDQLTRLIIEADLEGQGGSPQKFCEVWPQFQSGLSALQGLLALVPGVNIIAGPAIGIVLAAGTAASSAFCGKK